MNKFKVGDRVEVLDPGLIQLYEIMKRSNPDIQPVNLGRIVEVLEEEEYLIEFSIGDDPIEEHSQVAPYPGSLLRKID